MAVLTALSSAWPAAAGTASPLVAGECGSGIDPLDRLAYTVETDRPTHQVELTTTYDIWTIRGDGTGARRLTTTGAEHGPEFSPDGQQIVFESRREGQADIWVMGADGSNQRPLTHTPDVRESDPTWSPDGRRIAFHSQPITTLDQASYDIEVIHADGTGRQKLTNTPNAKEVKPSWSPDGSGIVYEGSSNAIHGVSPNDDIWVMSADGSHRRRLTTSLGREWYPQWSPDGRRIAFMSGRDVDFEIYVMNADGSAQTRLTHHLGEDGYPTWSPDGSRIVYRRSNSLIVPTPGVFVGTAATHAEIVAMRLDGSDPVTIVSRGLPDRPDVRPCP